MSTPLRTILQALVDRPEVAGAVVVSDEGLVVEAALPPAMDRDAVAALAATALRTLGGLTQSAGLGDPVQVVVDAPGGVLAVQRLAGSASLVVFAADAGDLGALLYELRRHGPALAPLV
ncbi:MAG: roadblock/LC7 domain-containing protein [Gemmatimonadales bacterium]|nr:roadblock/LC7 domain-containing protein [Gemmatimonadales bacterium]